MPISPGAVRGTRDPAARLLQLLSLLQAPRDWTGAELAERLGVTPRTIRRDVEHLRELGYPVQATQGNIGGYRLSAGTAMPPLLLDDDEAVAIAIGLRAAAVAAVSGIEDTSLRALAKLEQVLPSRLRRRVSHLAEAATVLAQPVPGPDAELLAALAAACVAREKIRFGYASARGASSRRLAEPKRLVAAGRRWYLVAYDLDRGDWRTFRVDRIEALHRTGARVPERELPGGQDAAAYVADALGAGPGNCRAELIVHAPIERAAEGVPASLGVLERLDEHRCRLRTAVDSPEYLAFRIAALRLDYTLVGPPEIVPHLRRIAERATASIADQDG
ncbi:helix-turn-helix transcriptional regulator [Streptomyces sp. GS7]|uniref:helix-turn-helix transcriptional regulator n=1 Tax=Streptomyces sp. GS7 TaxID=2692234 RepID=UPI001316F612|nr:WYL domain-containing protein [Streptomyces sp. GS7]QHC24580.1 WYL domain-containing protein [Streptomyces sp. GS7]